jgi:predicted DNA-binding transcriptional regulator AlpA
MSEDTKKPRAARKHKPRSTETDFVTKVELADHLGCSLDTLAKWVEKGTVPKPHSWPGARHAVWRRRDYQHYVDNGSWPS